MDTINNSKANDILIPIVVLMKDNTPTEVEEFVTTFYDEPWFTDSHKLSQRIRNIRAKLGYIVR